MAKNTIHIACPDGHRRKAQISDNSSLLPILDEVCREKRLDPSDWSLMHQRTKCDLSIPWRLLNIPNNTTLEMFKLNTRRKHDEVQVQLQLPDGSKYSGSFEPSVTLLQMLDWYRIQDNSMIAALDISMSGIPDLCPVCSYMREEVVGEYALSCTSLRDLGLTQGAAVIRYDIRSVSDDQLQRINVRADEKFFRNQIQQSEASVPASSKSTSAAKSSSTSSSSGTTTRKPAEPLAAPIFPTKNEGSSIFQDPPMRTASNPTTNKNHSRTLADELGIKFSLDPEPEHQSTDSFRHFQFSAATRGKDLISGLNASEQDRKYDQPCERMAIAYDVTRIGSSEKNSNKNDELSEKFYEVTPEDLRSMLKTLRDESSNETPLQTQTMRDRALGNSSLVYGRCAIRFVISSRYIVQALFRPEEPVDRLIEFVKTYLVCSNFRDNDFYLYTSQPRTILEDQKKTLTDYDLVPAAFVYLGHKKKTLQIQPSSKVPLRTIDEANRIVSDYVYRRVREDQFQRQASATTNRPSSAVNRTPTTQTPRNPSSKNVDDQHLREKLKKFLPTRK